MGVGVGDAIGERLGREAAEDHRVRSTDPSTGQHGHDRLGDHGHVDGHAVAGLDAEGLEGVRRPAGPLEQLGVGDVESVALGLADPVQCHLVTPACCHMTVEAVHRGVERAVGEPAGERRLPLEHRRERGVPLEGPRLLGPPGLRISSSGRVDVRTHVGLGDEGVGRSEAPILVQQCLDRLVVPFLCHRSPCRRGRARLRPRPGCSAQYDA